MGTNGYTVQCYLNGEPIDELPPEAVKIMSERLSRVVSAYVYTHPKECEKYIESLRKRNSAREEAPRVPS
ncbi:MAG: hypothetical protein IKC26_03005 [Clostridia bacterium]|nr:hypothetical protein [Clostridia bacterium]